LKLLLRRNAILVLAMAAPAGAVAQPMAGPYVNLGAGVSILQNAILKSAGGRTDLSVAPGAAVEAGAGIGVGGGLRLELEGDFAAARPRGSNGGGTTDTYGGFVNALYDFTTGTGFVPYLGIGAGYQALDLDRGESSSAFGYQGIAGLSYPVGVIPGLSLTAEYRLVGNALFTGGPPVSSVFDHQALLGLRYAFGTPPPAPPVEQGAAPPAPPPAEASTRTYLVFFDWDRADLSARARQIVAEAADASRHLHSTRIEVSGYTDASGTQTYNQSLSVRRAQTVEAELVRDGVAESDIAIHGFGASSPLVRTATGVREPQNRRVEIILH